MWASGEWECSVSTVQGNASQKVEIVVLETSASYCPAERVANNRGDFRWPRTLAGITAYQSCLQYPFTSVPLSGGAPGTRASRRCDRAGRWEPGDYSHCLYTNDITRVLYTFVLVRPGKERGREHAVSSGPEESGGEKPAGPPGPGAAQ